MCWGRLEARQQGQQWVSVLLLVVLVWLCRPVEFVVVPGNTLYNSYVCIIKL